MRCIRILIILLILIDQCIPPIRYVFTIVSYLIGVFIFATIVGQVGNVITNRNANRLEFERLLDGAKTYMRHHKVGTECALSFALNHNISISRPSIWHLSHRYRVE